MLLQEFLLEIIIKLDFVSKGISAIGNEFRVGASFINTATTNSATFRYTFYPF
jgi:hypothetical protein